MLWIFLIACILGLCIYKIRKAHSYWKNKGVPYVRPKFLVGSMPMLGRKSFTEQLIDDYNNFPKNRYHGIYQFLEPVLLIKDPELMKQIGVKQFEHFVDHRTLIPPETDPIWGKNLAAMTGEDWRDMRATLSPSFTSSKMKIMFRIINDCAKCFVTYFKETQKSEIEEYEMKDIFTRYTNDVIASTAFGIQCDSLREKNNDFYLMGKEATNFKGIRSLKFFMYSISPLMCKIFKMRIISKKITDYFGSIIKDTVETREKHNIIRPDMIHLLMEARKGRVQQEEQLKVNEGFSSVEEHITTSNNKKRPITIDDIISQAIVFFLAGFDTISRLLSFLFYEVAINPDIQNRLRDEILSIEGEVTYEKLLGLKYLDMVVSETLRKWSPAGITDRVVTKPFTIEPVTPDEKPLDLPLNAYVWFPIVGIHRDPKYYPEPDKFIPERFSDENKHNINPSTYLPFGIGPRNCIGSRFALLESKVLVYHVLKSFEVVPVERTHIPMVLATDDINIGAKGGMWLGFKKI